MVFMVDDSITAMYPGEDDAGGGFTLTMAIAPFFSGNDTAIPKLNIHMMGLGGISG